MALAHLQWEEIHQSFGSGLKDIWMSEELFDVTLVCGDNRQVPAHKVVLASCSSFFRTILNKSPHPNPLIYLKGVHYNDLNSILSFMYSGEAKVSQSHLKEFLEVAEDLQIKGLIKDNSILETELKRKRISESAFEPEPKKLVGGDTFQLPLKTELFYDESSDYIPNHVVNPNPAQMLNIYSFSDECPPPDILENGKFCCKLCSSVLKNRKQFTSHMKYMHGTKVLKKEYVCDVCETKFTNRRQMLRCKHRPLTEEETIEENAAALNDESNNDEHFLSEIGCHSKDTDKSETDPFIGLQMNESATDAFLGL